VREEKDDKGDTDDIVCLPTYLLNQELDLETSQSFTEKSIGRLPCPPLGFGPQVVRKVVRQCTTNRLMQFNLHQGRAVEESGPQRSVDLVSFVADAHTA
jgi:hypothetical protein